MKNFLLLLGFFVLANTVTLYAQVRPGIKGSINYSSMESKYLPDSDGGTGYSFGGFLDVPVSGWFHLEPSLLYSVKQDKALIEGDRVRLRHNYIDIPFLMRFYVADGFNLFIGPQMSVTLDAKTIIDLDEGQFRFNTENVEELLFCLNLGMGYRLENGLNIQLGYEYDWSGSLEKVNNVDPDANIGTLQLSTAYTF